MNQPPPVAPSIPSDKSKADEPPGETRRFIHWHQSLLSRGETLFRRSRRKESVEAVNRFLGDRGVPNLMVCGVLVYLNIRAAHSPSPQAQGEKVPPRSETAFQPSKSQTTRSQWRRHPSRRLAQRRPKENCHAGPWTMPQRNVLGSTA